MCYVKNKPSINQSINPMTLQQKETRSLRLKLEFSELSFRSICFTNKIQIIFFFLDKKTGFTFHFLTQKEVWLVQWHPNPEFGIAK